MNSYRHLLLTPAGLAFVQLTVLFGLAWLAHALLRQSHPRWRVILWRSVLCFSVAIPTMALLPTRLARIPVYLEPPAPEFRQVAAAFHNEKPAPSSPRIGATITQIHSAPAAKAPRRWTLAKLITSCWAAGFCAAMLRLARFHVQLACLRRRTVAAVPAIAELAETLRREMGLKVAASIRLSDCAASPFVCGALRPIIVLPGALANTMESRELKAVLLHELAHIRGNDVAWNLAWRWVSAILWFHPLTWLAAAAHSLACEEQADRMASNSASQQSGYAQILAGITLRILRPPTVETTLTLNGAAEIVRRLEHLAQSRIRPWSRRRTVAGYLLAAALLAGSASWELSRSRAAVPRGSTKLTYRDLVVIVQDDKGNPLESAVVEPYAFRVKGPKAVDHYGWDRLRPRKHVTDESGQTRVRYAVEAFPDEKLLMDVISLTVRHPDYTPAIAHLHVDAPPEPVRLTPGIHIRVSAFTGPDRTPVTEIVPNLSGEPRPQWMTNEDGTLSCHQLTAGPYMLQLMGRLASGEIGYSEAIAFRTTREKAEDVIETDGKRISLARREAWPLSVEIKQGLRVEGRLDASVPRPVTDGRVIVSVRPPQFLSSLVAEDLGELKRKNGDFDFWRSYRAIEPDGTFVFESVPPGELDVIALGEGFASRNGGQGANRLQKITIGTPQAFPLAKQTNSIEVATEKTATLNIDVITTDGEPVKGMIVQAGPNLMRLPGGIFGSISSTETPFRILPQMPNIPPWYGGRTDERGHVVLSSIPAVARRLELEHPEYQVPLVDGWSRDVHLSIAPGQTTNIAVTVQKKGKDFIGDIGKTKGRD